MVTITEGLPEFKSLEREFFLVACKAARHLLQEYLGKLDMRIAETRDKKRYRLIRRSETTVKTIMGEVPFGRNYYFDKHEGKRVFLLDEAIGISSGCGLYSENLVEQIVAECTDKAFRKVSDGITAFTGQDITAMGAWGVFQRYADNISKQEDRLKELDDCGSVGHLGNVQTPVLFEEYDDVHLPVQKPRRRKHGMPARKTKTTKKKKRKAGTKAMHVNISYTGWTQSKDGRYSTADKMAYASFGSVPEFAGKVDMLQRHCYDMDGVERRITNGDGAKWINTVAEEHGSILQLDPFHRSQAIIKSIGDKDGKKRMFDALEEKDAGKVLNIALELFEKEADEKRKKKLGELHAYFSNNRENLLTWRERGIDLPAPPEGITYKDMGVQESSNCNILTLRMKHRKGSWSEKGGNNMAKILCYRKTIGLDAILGTLPEPAAAEPWLDPLSATKSPEHDGKGYGADWLYAPMPFETVARTHGREIIREMVSCKPLSELALR